MVFLNSVAKYRRLLSPFGIVRLVLMVAIACRLMMPDCGVAAGERVLPDAPWITAPSAIVVDMATGGIIYAKGADDRRYPASTTKIMTGILTL